MTNHEKSLHLDDKNGQKVSNQEKGERKNEEKRLKKFNEMASKEWVEEMNGKTLSRLKRYFDQMCERGSVL